MKLQKAVFITILIKTAFTNELKSQTFDSIVFLRSSLIAELNRASNAEEAACIFEKMKSFGMCIQEYLPWLAELHLQEGDTIGAFNLMDEASFFNTEIFISDYPKLNQTIILSGKNLAVKKIGRQKLKIRDDIISIFENDQAVRAKLDTNNQVASQKQMREQDSININLLYEILKSNGFPSSCEYGIGIPGMVRIVLWHSLQYLPEHKYNLMMSSVEDAVEQGLLHYNVYYQLIDSYYWRVFKQVKYGALNAALCGQDYQDVKESQLQQINLLRANEGLKKLEN